MFVTCFTQSADIIFSHFICHQAAYVPQETVGFSRTSDEVSPVCRKVWCGVIAIPLFKIFQEPVRKITSAPLVTVHNHHCESFAVRGRYPFKDLADECARAANANNVNAAINILKGKTDFPLSVNALLYLAMCGYSRRAVSKS
jgi:hypothetical protein